MIDLRSDTVTIPTLPMRELMANAPVGDDVYGEDPSINHLQEMSAQILGKEAGLFIPSGTMGNLVAILTHCDRGDEVILGNKAHTFLYEVGGISALGGVHSCQLPNQKDGTLKLDDLRTAIRDETNIHFPKTRLICLENTHNRCGGVTLSMDYNQEVQHLAHHFGIPIHLDGARLFNAAVALGISAKTIADTTDSVTFCLSKGLCAPVGSVLCGSQAFIDRARRIRKQLGGGMRQAGILAAAGIYALETMIDRLKEDHQHAKDIAEALSKQPGIILDMGLPQTNMVFLRLAENISLTASEVAEHMKEKNILIGIIGTRQFRLVTHYWIDDIAVDQTISAFQSILS